MSPSDAESQDVIHVLPLGDVADDANAWALLDQGQAVAIARVSRTGQRSGQVYSAASSAARSLQPLLSKVDAVPGDLWRVELPTGASLDHLVRANGGGYRGMVRFPGASGIQGQARLIPAAASGTKASLKVASAGIFAVAIAADYMAQQELLAKLERIQRSVDLIHKRFESQDRAILKVALDTITEAHAAVAGELSPPRSLGLDATASQLRQLLAREGEWVDELTHAAQKIAALRAMGKLDEDGVPISTFEELIGMDNLHKAPGRYVERVANYYKALVLDSQLAVLAAAEAELASEEASLDAFQLALERRLRANARRQEQLMEATEAIAREPITSKLLQRKLEEAHDVERVLLDVAFGLKASARLPEMVNAQGRQQLEVEVLEGGQLRLVEPRK